MKIWAKTKEFFEGKFLVVRRDGSVPHWPHFVLGARDPAAPYALHAYASRCHDLGLDREYVDSLHALAADFERYREDNGDGDPDAPPHRTDDPFVIHAMRGHDANIYVRVDKGNFKNPAEAQLAARDAEIARLREALSTVSGMRTGNGDPWGLIDAMRNCADTAIAALAAPVAEKEAK